MALSPHEKSEALLNSPMQRLSTKYFRFATRYRLPSVHGCVWDRHCRWSGAPRRIDVRWGRHNVWVDLPGHDKPTRWRTQRDSTMHEAPGSWQLLPQFRRHSRAKDDYAKFRNDYLSRKET